MHVLQSNCYIFEDSFFVWRDTAFDWKMPVAGTFCVPCFFLPEVLYRVRYEMGLCSCFKLSNAYLHSGKNTTWSKWRAIFSKEVTFYKGMLPIEKESSFLLSECYTFWMKVFVCKACTCQLELLLEKKDSCLIVFCGKVIYSVFTAFFRFGEKTEIYDSFHVEASNLDRYAYVRVPPPLESKNPRIKDVHTRIPTYQDLHTLSPKTNINMYIYICGTPLASKAIQNVLK